MKVILLAWLLLASNLLFAQTPGVDVIHKLDRTKLTVKIDELTDSDIIYVEPAVPNKKKTIARNQVWKVVFSDGSTEMITALAGQTATSTDQIVLVDQTVVDGKVVRRDAQKLYYTKPNDPTNSQFQFFLTRIDRIRYADGREEVLRKTQEPPTSKSEPIQPVDAGPARMADGRAFSRLHLTVGPEISLFSQSGPSRWSNEMSGMGMNQSLGGSVRIDYQLFRALAISFTGGYSKWELVRNYLQSNQEKYDETIQLRRIPLQAGIKLYPFGGFYLLPEGGVNLFTTTVKTTGTHPTPTDIQSSTTPLTYGASLGYEFRMGSLLIDLSGRYQILDVKNLNYGTIAPSLTEKVKFGSLRVGIGFNAFKK